MTKTSVKLKSLKMTNFKGIKERTLTFTDGTNTITAPNGWGKTSVKNAFEWLLCQNVQDVLPTKNNKEIPFLTTSVVGVLDVNGFEYTLERTSKSKYTQNGQKSGNEATYKVDGIELKEKDYKGKIADLFGVGAFENLPIITDKEYFNTDTPKFKWTDRRKLLFEICGVNNATQSLTMKPEYASIRNYLIKGFATSDIKSMLSKSKRGYKEQQGKNNILIEQKEYENNELRKTDFDAVERQIADLQAKHKEMLTASTAEQQTNEIKRLQAEIATLTKEKAELENADLATKTNLQKEIRNLYDKAQTTKQEYDIEKNTLLTLLAKTLKVGDTCQTCGHTLTDEDIQRLTSSGANNKQEIDKKTEEVKILVERYNTTKKKFTEKQQELANFTPNPRIIELENALKSATMAQKSVETQDLKDLSIQQIHAVETQISALTKTLRDKEYLQTNEKNIAMWKESNRALADQIVGIEKQEAELSAYIKEQTDLVVATVNSHFTNGVSWALFNETYKGGEGGIEECCVLLYNGKRYTSLSTGERNVANIECIKALQDYYNINILIFSDNAESITLPLDYGGRQAIELRAEKSRN